MKSIKVGFLGFGRSGHDVVGEFLKDEAFEVAWIVRKTAQDRNKYASRLLGHDCDCGRIFSIKDVKPDFFKQHPVDVLVDFSAKNAIRHYFQGASQGVKIISAISNYSKAQMKLLNVLKKKTAVLYSPNITLGINFLLVASQLLQKIAPHADIEIIEEHFRHKKDVSGTALKIAKVLGLDRKRHVNSIRVGSIVGKHEVVFGLPNQTVRLVHESISRRAFGQGAIFVAKWLIEKPKGLYSMENIVADMIRKNLPVY